MKNLKLALITSLLASALFFVLMWLIEDITIIQGLIQSGVFFICMLIGELFIFPYFDNKFNTKK